MNKLKCTKEEFMAYEDVRKSGVTNMFAIKTVEELTGLDQLKISNIMTYYSEYAQKYLEAC
ncbi:MAG TPA: hypothetical protein PLG47_06355 [Candidatus Dojkabacteria bacterium]|nr:hypothetical protein [Candidatus Dojkabacteria bacterium]